MSTRYPDTVELLRSTASALDGLVCYVGTQNVSMENMAWLWFVCRELPDSEELFPHGKWATVQHIEGQLVLAAQTKAAQLASPSPTSAGENAPNECAKWDCDGDHKYYSHNPTTGELEGWEEA